MADIKCEGGLYVAICGCLMDKEYNVPVELSDFCAEPTHQPPRKKRAPKDAGTIDFLEDMKENV